MDRNPPILFFGTTEFAAHSLETLLATRHNIKAIVTTKDKKAGRGLNIQSSDVKKCAGKYHIPVLQPEKLDAISFVEKIAFLRPALIIVIAFRKLPKEIWSIPTFGTINLHASLLPNYRGAAPIQHTIMNGEVETGVSIIRINDTIDAGEIISQKKTSIPNSMNARELHDKLKKLGAELLLKTLPDIFKKNETPIQQQNKEYYKKAPKLKPSDALINFNNPFQEIYNQIRGLSPYPGAYTVMNGKRLKILSTSTQKENCPVTKVGELHTDYKNYLHFISSDGCINCTKVQLEGKKAMPVKDFLNGWKSSGKKRTRKVDTS